MSRIYSDGRHYDRMYPENPEALSFWTRMAGRHGDPILELGCGTGRFAIPLARAGFDVIGVDISQTMLERARSKMEGQKLTVEWVEKDMRNFDLNRTFRMIFLPVNTLCHLLTTDDFEACMTCVRRHLHPDGAFITEIFNPDLTMLTQNSEERRPFASYEHPDGDGTVVVTCTSRYDAATQIKHNTLYHRFPGSDKEIADLLLMRIYFPQELDALCRYNGFSIMNRYGDFYFTPFSSFSSAQILELKRL